LSSDKDIVHFFKKAIPSLLILCFFSTIYSAPNKAKEATKKKEEVEKRRSEEAAAQRQARIDKHYNMQTKDVQKRMKKNKALTKNYYKKRRNQNWFTDLFKKKHECKGVN
jgi:hypothetical protein